MSYRCDFFNTNQQNLNNSTVLANNNAPSKKASPKKSDFQQAQIGNRDADENVEARSDEKEDAGDEDSLVYSQKTHNMSLDSLSTMNFSAEIKTSKFNVSKMNNPNLAIPVKPLLQIELYLHPLQIYVAPVNQPYFPHTSKPSTFEPLTLFVSLFETMASVHSKVLQSLSHHHQGLIANGKVNTVRAAQGTPPLALLLSHSRLWRVEMPDEGSLDQMLQEVQIESRYSDVSDFAQVEIEEGSGHVVEGEKKVKEY